MGSKSIREVRRLARAKVWYYDFPFASLLLVIEATMTKMEETTIYLIFCDISGMTSRVMTTVLDMCKKERPLNIMGSSKAHLKCTRNNKQQYVG